MLAAYREHARRRWPTASEAAVSTTALCPPRRPWWNRRRGPSRTGWQVNPLTGARIIDQATTVLQDFLPRYNARFAVQPEHPEPAYRPVGPDLCLPEIVCFKDTRKVSRENTVKYNWRVLLLPVGNTSYAGLQVKVLERPDGELTVR